MPYQFKTIDERPENSDFEDEAVIQRYIALKAMFIVRQAVHKYLANKDKAPGHQGRKAKLEKLDDNEFFRVNVYNATIASDWMLEWVQTADDL